MAQIKAHEVARYLTKPNPAHCVFLIYGPDRGLVAERAKAIALSTGVDASDPFSMIKLDADDAAADPSRIADEAFTVSMFGGKRVIWISGSTQKNLANAIQPILDTAPSDAIVVIEAGDLKKTAALRSKIEKSTSAVALPCYQDQARALDDLINEELANHGLSMEGDARQVLKDNLGGDRLASRMEVQKLCLYAGKEKSVTIDDVHAIVGDASALAIDTVVDAVSVGNISTMEATFKRLAAQGTAVFQILAATQRHFQMLHQARSQMESGNQSAASILGGMRPPINFQRKDRVLKALSIWPLSNLNRVLKRLEGVSLDSRANAGLSQALAATALLAITIEAKRLNR